MNYKQLFVDSWARSICGRRLIPATASPTLRVIILKIWPVTYRYAIDYRMQIKNQITIIYKVLGS